MNKKYNVPFLNEKKMLALANFHVIRGIKRFRVCCYRKISNCRVIMASLTTLSLIIYLRQYAPRFFISYLDNCSKMLLAASLLKLLPVLPICTFHTTMKFYLSLLCSLHSCNCTHTQCVYGRSFTIS